MIVRAMIAGIILAAGFSERMGRPKALLPVGAGGPTFVHCLVGTLRQGGLDPVIVVAGVDAVRIRTALHDVEPPVLIAVNEDPSRGQLSSLAAALDLADRPEVEAALVVPVDQPLVTPATLARLVGVYRGSHAPIVRPICGGRHGHPVIFDRLLFDELRRADPAEGARSIVRAHAAATVNVPIVDEGAFTDIDTRDDYERVFGSFPRED